MELNIIIKSNEIIISLPIEYVTILLYQYIYPYLDIYLYTYLK